MGYGTRGSARAPLLASRSPLMSRLVEQLTHVAGEEVTVLLTGESGTGKSVLARVLHDGSRRAGGPFVEVNCAALAEGVLESELFGHERGAFTGAVRQRVGRVEQAHGGTLFLDEIGAADARVQMRLLRVLQERRFERVGGERTRTADVRVVAATNTDLESQVRAGAFREDLFYRLHVVPFRVPPLRERPEDLPLLARHLLSRRRADPPQLDARALDALRAYPWPGNVRELENTLERMTVLSPGPRLTLADVPPEIVRWREIRGGDELSELGAESYREARERFDRRFLCRALRRHQGVLAHVAESVGLSRKYLYRKLEDLGIDADRFRPQEPG